MIVYCICVPKDNADGCAQLVGDIGSHLAAYAGRSIEFFTHSVKRCRQFA